MLAIVIPYFKLTFFEATLQSLASQTCQEFKVYIGNDASPEDPSMLLEKYKGKFDFVYHRFESNLGGISLSKQWERCITMSDNEEWLMILGDDDVLGENVVAEFYPNKFIVEEKGINLIRYATVVIDENNNHKTEPFFHPVFEKSTDFFFRKIKNETRSSLSEYIFKREAYDKYKFKDFPLAWYTDDMAWLDFSGKSTVLSINDAIVFFRFSNENISGKTNNMDLKEEAKFLFYKKIIEDNLSFFSKMQAWQLLTTYEVLLKKRNQFNISKKYHIAMKLLKLKKITFLFQYMKRQFKNSIKRK